MFTSALQLALGLTLGNFLYQVVTTQRDWHFAFTASWFQFCALLIFAWMKS